MIKLRSLWQKLSWRRRVFYSFLAILFLISGAGWAMGIATAVTRFGATSIKPPIPIVFSTAPAPPSPTKVGTLQPTATLPPTPTQMVLPTARPTATGTLVPLPSEGLAPGAGITPSVTITPSVSPLASRTPSPAPTAPGSAAHR